MRVAVVGLGPAGRALAHRLLVRGVDVLAVDPAPEKVWEATYGGWLGQVPAWLLEGSPDVVASTSRRTVLRAHGQHTLLAGGAEAYAVLDNASLHRALDLAGAEIRREVVEDADLPGLAPVVVDCRGARQELEAEPRPMQSAFGVRVEPPVAAPLLGGADAVLMDWRPFDGASAWGERAPSFCYVIPLGDRVLVEETSLAAEPAMSLDELRRRLQVRLGRYDIQVSDDVQRDVEHVMIPMLPPSPGPVPRFGASSGELNPITGYSVFGSLASADATAAELVATGTIRPRGSRWRRTALDAVLHLSSDHLVSLFDAFGQLPAGHQRAIFDPHTPASRLLPALARQWWRMPLAGKLGLVRATIEGALA